MKRAQKNCNPQLFFLSAGEASGDGHAARLTAEIRRLRPGPPSSASTTATCAPSRWTWTGPSTWRPWPPLGGRLGPPHPRRPGTLPGNPRPGLPHRRNPGQGLRPGRQTAGAGGKKRDGLSGGGPVSRLPALPRTPSHPLRGGGWGLGRGKGPLKSRSQAPAWERH